ncbi:MAG: hypothetical protein IJ766_03705 [Clostridia bacterium]|nr:hypothetical protein [Clostridia bacterium]
MKTVAAEQITLEIVVPLDWDSAYVFASDTSGDVIAEMLGFDAPVIRLATADMWKNV